MCLLLKHLKRQILPMTLEVFATPAFIHMSGPQEHSLFHSEAWLLAGPSGPSYSRAHSQSLLWVAHGDEHSSDNFQFPNCVITSSIACPTGQVVLGKRLRDPEKTQRWCSRHEGLLGFAYEECRRGWPDEVEHRCCGQGGNCNCGGGDRDYDCARG